MKTRNVIAGLTSRLRSLAMRVIPAIVTLTAGALFLPGVASAQTSSSGNDFMVGFLSNLLNTGAVELHLTSPVSMSVQVEYPVGTNLGAPVALTPGNVSIVSIPDAATTGWPTGAPALNAVRAHSVNPSQRFTCYMINRRSATSDAALALPVDSLGNFYRVMTAVPTLGGDQTFGSQFVVVATQDGTTVTITPSQNLQSGQAAGTPFNVNLNRGQGWLATGTTSGPGGDLTGSTVQASLPVSMTNGVGCVNIDEGACDHVFEVAQSVQTWGTGIPAANLPGFDTTGVRYRIMAADNNTTVLQDGAAIGVLSAGQFITTPRLTGSHFFDGVEAGNPKPIFVMQFMPGGATGICASGDPAIGNIIPAAQYQSSYTFSAVGGNQFACNFVTIIATNSDVGTLTLDSVPVPAGLFTAIGTSGYSSALVPITSAVHQTASAHPHGLTVEGYNSFDSYLYPGGALLNPINVDLVLTKDDQVSICAPLNGAINYRVCYQNTGNSAANNVSIVDTLPLELDFVSASDGGVYAPGPRTVTWSVGTAPANMPSPVCFDLAVTVNNTATPGGEIVNRVSIDSDETDPTAIQKRTTVCTSTPTPAPTQTPAPTSTPQPTPTPPPTATPTPEPTPNTTPTPPPNCPTITVKPVNLPNGKVGQAYSKNLIAVGGSGPYTFVVEHGNLPTGLTLASNGVLSGTPTAEGIFYFIVLAQDRFGCTGKRQYWITINCPTITLAPSTLPNALKNSPYSQTITATGGTSPYHFALYNTQLPPGLSLSPGGILSGTPTVHGTFQFTIVVKDQYGCDRTRQYRLVITRN